MSFNKSNIGITIKDNGVGFEVNEAFNAGDRPRGLGLVGMAERVDYTGGDFEIKSSLRKGTRMIFRIPLEPKKQPQTSANRYLWSKYPKNTLL